MQITVPRGQLKEAVAGFNKVVPHRVTLPILGCVRFESGHNGISANVTDLDQHLRYRFVGAQTVGEGTFILPLANLKDLAQGKPDETIRFETSEKGRIGVTNHVGDHEVTHPVTAMDPDDWPVGPAEIATKPADRFLDTYRRLVRFAATDPTRYALNSVHVDVADKGEHPVTMVATDGRRLSCWNTMNLPLSKSVTVPTTKFLQWSGLTGEAGIGIRTTQEKKETRAVAFTLSVGPWSYDTKAVDVTYPNWRQVIPGVDDSAARIVFTDDDVALLKKVLPTFPGSTTHDSGIRLRPGDSDRLMIAGRGPDDQVETALELIGGSTYVGKLPAIGVNCFFLLDALEAGFRAFTASGELSPLRAEDGRGGIHVLMPLRLGNEPMKQPDPKPEKAPGAEAPHAETTTPAVLPVADQKPKGDANTMTKETNGIGTTEPSTALDRLQAAYEAARLKVRDANQALADVAGAIKDAVKENRQLKADVENVRAGLAKLQSIKV